MKSRAHPLVRASLAFVLLPLAAGLGCGASEPSSPVAEAVTEGRLPELALPDLNGGEVRLADRDGTVLLLDFWATWCTPCRAQARILEPLYEEYKDRGVEFYAIDSGENADTVRRYVEKTPFPYPVLLDSDDRLGVALDILALPTLVVVDREGKVAYFNEGVVDGEELRRVLDRAGA